MKKTIRILCLILTLLIFASVLSGCGDKKTTTDGKVSLRWMNSVAIDSDSVTEKYLEDRYNVEIETVSVTSNYTEKLGAMLASGDVPDVFMVNEPEIWMSLAKRFAKAFGGSTKKTSLLRL